MDFGADVMRDEPDDALAVGGREQDTAIGDPCAETIDPEPAVGIEHDFDDRGVGKPLGNRAAKRCPQHAGTTSLRLETDRFCAHDSPRWMVRAKAPGSTGMSKRRKDSLFSTEICARRTVGKKDREWRRPRCDQFRFGGD
jgi:hypothetical protein